MTCYLSFRHTAFVFLFFVCLFAVNADGSEKMGSPDRENSVDAPEPYFSEESLKWIDETQAEWSQDISNLGAYLDSVMWDVESLQDHNRSYLKIYLGVNASKHDDTELKDRVRFSLDLPLIKKKLRLVFESEPDQERSLEERNLSQLPGNQQEESEGLYASFRYLFDSSKWQRLSFDWGVKAKWRPDLFARARAVRNWEVNENWGMLYSQELFWFESKGLGARAQFDFNRPINESFLFRVTNAVDWLERGGRYGLLEQVSLFHNISYMRAVQYALGFTGEHLDHHSVVTSYFVKATYRRRIYKDWLFYQMTSGLEFPREHSFQHNPFIAIGIECLFSADADRKLHPELY